MHISRLGREMSLLPIALLLNKTTTSYSPRTQKRTDRHSPPLKSTMHSKTFDAFHLSSALKEILDSGEKSINCIDANGWGPEKADDVDTVLMSCERTKSHARFYIAIRGKMRKQHDGQM